MCFKILRVSTRHLKYLSTLDQIFIVDTPTMKCILIEIQKYREKALRSLFKKMYVFETNLYFGTALSKMKISYHKMYHFILPSLQK